MRENKIIELKQQILEDKVNFLDAVIELVNKNKILYSDNYKTDDTKDYSNEMSYLIPFMHLLYRGSKHSIGHMAESGFTRVILYKNNYLKFTYNDGPETFVTVRKLDENQIKNVKPIVTLELLKERLTESENVKNELAPIIEKYLRAGLTFEEITRMFVEIMRENRIQI